MPFAAFRAAVEAADPDAFVPLLAEDVVFCSPAVHRPYEGKAATLWVLRAVVTVFEDFRYTDELPGDPHGLVFRARIGERELQGIDLLRARDGLITELTVMIRPLSGLNALVAAMASALEAS